jgi:serralysin
MTTSITNSALAVTVSISQSEIFIDGVDEDITAPLPYDGVFPYGYDFDIAGSEDNFVLFYSGEFGQRDGKLVSLGGSDQSGVSYIGGAAVAQFYGYDGVPIGDPIWISSQANGGTRPGIGALGNGEYLAVWQVNDLEGYPVLGDRILYIVGRTLSHDGTALGETFVIAAGVPLLETGVPPTVNEVDGQIVVGWSSYSTQFGAIDLSTVNSGQSGDISNIVYGSDQADTVFTFGGTDVVYGLGGSDQIDAGTNNDQLVGGVGNDTLTGGDGNDTVGGGGGNDLIVGGSGAGDDVYQGGAGVDTVTYTSAVAGIVVNLVAGTAGSIAGNDAAGIGTDQLSAIENVIAGRFNDRISGSGSANQLAGADGNDALDGRAGDDKIYGGNGKDTLVGGLGNDILSGGPGVDGASYQSASAGVTVNLAVDTAQATGGAGIDTLTSIANLVGSAFADTLIGNRSANSLTGGHGDDTLSGNAGSDRLGGGDGADLLSGDAGNDRLIGGSGNDTFCFNAAIGSSNVDVIKDFVAAEDAIQLDDAVFAGIGPVGVLAPAAFAIGTEALDADDRIIFNSATGELFYDADGSGEGVAMQFALLPNRAVVDADDFFVV